MDFVVDGWSEMKDEVGETRRLILGHNDATWIWNPLSLTNLCPSMIMKRERCAQEESFVDRSFNQSTHPVTLVVTEANTTLDRLNIPKTDASGAALYWIFLNALITVQRMD